MKQNNRITYVLGTGALLVCAGQINMLHAAEFSQQSPIVYDGTNRTYETPPVGGWEGVLEKEEAELQRAQSMPSNTNNSPPRSNAWEVPSQQSQPGKFSVLRNNHGATQQNNTYNVPQKNITWDSPQPYQQPGEYYSESQNTQDYPTQAGTYGAPQQTNEWSVPAKQPDTYYSEQQNPLGNAVQGNARNNQQQAEAWDAPKPYQQRSESYEAAKKPLNNEAQGGASGMPHSNTSWDDPQVAQGIWNHRYQNRMAPRSGNAMTPPDRSAMAPAPVNPQAYGGQPAYGNLGYQNPGYGRQGYGNQGYATPGYSAPGFRGPVNRGNSGSGFMPWGGRNSGGMIPGKGAMSRNWDDMLNEPSRAGKMPGGWRAPSISAPNPVDVGDEFQDSAKDLPDQMNNFRWNNR